MDIKPTSKIYIIESPAKEDLAKGRTEGAALCEILKLADIPHAYFTVTDIDSFKTVFADVAAQINGSKDEHADVALHFSMHGNKDGLGLMSGQFLNWLQFAKLVVDFVSEVGTFKHPTSGKRFCPVKLHFSVCYGFNAKALKELSSVDLYWSLVGPTEPVNWSDSLIAFATLYHNSVHKPIAYDKAVEKMNLAAGLQNIFQLDLAEGWAIKSS